MSQEDPFARPRALGERDAPSGRGPLEVAAPVAAVLWLLIAGGYVVLSPGLGTVAMRGLLVLSAVLLPVVLLWVAVTALRAARIMREEGARLRAAVDALRHAYVSEVQAGRRETTSQIGRRLDEIAAAQRKTEAALAQMVGAGAVPPAGPPRPDAPAPPHAPEGGDEGAGAQAAFALGTPSETHDPPPENADLTRALNFPETAEDSEGFAALRRALRDRPAAQLIQAAQDVLTLLAQDGIYMDDLRPDMARPELWRRFARGARGREIAALGGVRDRTSLALSAARMKGDPIFRDAAHHFLRLFDRGLARFEPGATDAELSELADTRSARAFMLLGRVAGTFD